MICGIEARTTELGDLRLSTTVPRLIHDALVLLVIGSRPGEP